jgi:hypothetical protein
MKIDNILLFCRRLMANDLRTRLASLNRKRVFAKKQSLEVSIMKLVQSLIIAAALAVPAVSFAASNVADNGVAQNVSASGTHHPLRTVDQVLTRVDHKIRASIRPDANDGMKSIYFGA